MLFNCILLFPLLDRIFIQYSRILIKTSLTNPDKTEVIDFKNLLARIYPTSQ